MTRFRRGEGIWFDAGIVYVATTSDSKVHAYETVTETIEVLYDEGLEAARSRTPTTSPSPRPATSSSARTPTTSRCA